VVTVRSVEPVEKEEKPEIILKAIVESCQQIKNVVPTDVGIVSRQDSLRVIRGYVENRGNVPVNYVRVRVNWRDKDDRTIDYDLIYATAGELLMPGKQARFETGKNNLLIAKCSAKVVDWWVTTGEPPPDEVIEAAKSASEGGDS